MSGYRGEAGSLEGEDVQVEPQQEELQEVSTYPQPQLDEVGGEYHHEVDQHSRK